MKDDDCGVSGERKGKDLIRRRRRRPSETVAALHDLS